MSTRATASRVFNAWAPASSFPTPLPSPAPRPLSGWRVGVKANLWVRGQPADASSHALAGFLPRASATAVVRALAAGATLDARRTNMDEFGMGSATTHSVHGATLSPFSANAHPLLAARGASRLAASSGWLTAGGSSGGAAVSVATGEVRAALASDTGGSVRLPASFCGVVGLKPTYGCIPRHGLIPYACSLDTVGVIARTVADAAALLRVVAGPDALDGTSALRGSVGDADLSCDAAAGDGERPLPLRGLRVGVPIEYHVEGTAAHLVDAWEWGAAALERAGAVVTRVSLPHTSLGVPAYYVLAPAEAASNLARYDGVRYGHREDVRMAEGSVDPQFGAAAPPASAASGLHAWFTRTRTVGLGAEAARRVLAGNAVLAGVTRSEYYDAAALCARLVSSDFSAVFRREAHRTYAPPASLIDASNPAAWPCASDDTGVDVLLTLTAPNPPWVASDTDSLPPLTAALGDVCTVPASLAHLPAISVPVAHAPYPSDALARTLLEHGIDAGSAVGLELARDLRVPVGLQVIGRHGDERTVLRVAAALERSSPRSSH